VKDMPVLQAVVQAVQQQQVHFERPNFIRHDKVWPVAFGTYFDCESEAPREDRTKMVDQFGQHPSWVMPSSQFNLSKVSYMGMHNLRTDLPRTAELRKDFKVEEVRQCVPLRQQRRLMPVNPGEAEPANPQMQVEQINPPDGQEVRKLVLSYRSPSIGLQ
jgi:hypothetical protein